MKKTDISITNALQCVCLAVFSLYILVIFFKPVEFEDVWWHIRTGEWISEHNGVPHGDVFPFSLKVTPGISPQWLGSYTYYLIHHLGGALGLKIFRTIFMFCMILIFYFYAKRKIPIPCLLGLVFLILPAFFKRTHLRPFVFNYLFVQSFLIILFSYLKSNNRRILYSIPLLGVIWFNVHLGHLVYGGSILTIFLFSSLIERIQSRDESSLKAAQTRIKDLSILLGLYTLTFLASPYGWEGTLYPFKVFLIPEFINFSKLAALIHELKPPGYMLSHLSGIWFYALAFTGLIALGRAKQHKMLLTILFVFSLFIFLKGRRGYPFFVIVASYVTVEALQSTQFLNTWKNFKHRYVIENLVYAGFSIVLMIFLVQNINSTSIHDGQKKRILSLDYRPGNPMPSVDLLKKHHCLGPIFADSVYGGYILWSSYPQLRPLADSRQINQQLFGNYVAIRSDPDRYWPLAEKQYDLNIVMLDVSLPRDPKLIRYLLQHPDWTIINIQGSIMTLVKKDHFSLPPGLKNYEHRLKHTQFSNQEIKKIKETLKKPIPQGLKSFLLPPPVYHDTVEEAITLFDFGFKEAAVHKILEALGEDNNPTSQTIGRTILQQLETHDPKRN